MIVLRLNQDIISSNTTSNFEKSTEFEIYQQHYKFKHIYFYKFFSTEASLGPFLQRISEERMFQRLNAADSVAKRYD